MIRMNTKILALIFAFFLMRPTVVCACEDAVIPIYKGFYKTGEQPTYRYPLMLSYHDQGNGVTRPRSIAEGVFFLKNGMQRKIVEGSVSALNLACDHQIKCNLASPGTWDRFIETAEQIEVEPGYSLSGYLIQLDEAIAEEWHLYTPCIDSVGICKEFARNQVYASASILADVLVRDVIVDASGRSWSFSDAVESLGDLAQKHPPN